MRALLDVNFVIALFDPDHVFHERSHDWWAANRTNGWASCPLTENGVVRIMSNPNYSRKARFTPGDIIARVEKFATDADHEFWPDEISLRDESFFDRRRLHTSHQLTDLYLLALATQNNGRLVTFDTAIPISAVVGAEMFRLSVP
ncbi:MAG: TA system VapC family ribonuclease toxin [Acidobacteriota bacterium]